MWSCDQPVWSPGYAGLLRLQQPRAPQLAQATRQPAPGNETGDQYAGAQHESQHLRAIEGLLVQEPAHERRGHRPHVA